MLNYDYPTVFFPLIYDTCLQGPVPLIWLLQLKGAQKKANRFHRMNMNFGFPPLLITQDHKCNSTLHTGHRSIFSC